MNRPFSLAHLTMLSVPPPQLVETAARAGYQFVSLRPIPVGAPNEPLYPLGTDRALLARTKAALAATGVGLLDIEVARIIKEVKPRDYLPALEAAAELGGRHVLSSAWCDDRPYILEFFCELCELAQPFGLTVDLEFVTWSGVRTLDEAVEVVKEARCPNAGIVVDTLHFDRCHAELEKLSALPREWFHFAQISDAPATLFHRARRIDPHRPRGAAVSRRRRHRRGVHPGTTAAGAAVDRDSQRRQARVAGRGAIRAAVHRDGAQLSGRRRVPPVRV